MFVKMSAAVNLTFIDCFMLCTYSESIMSFKIVRCPREGDVFLNCLHIHPLDVKEQSTSDSDTTTREDEEKKIYAEVDHGQKKHVLLVHENAYLKRKCVAFNGLHRSWIGVGIGSHIDISIFNNQNLSPVSSLVVEVDYLHKMEENEEHPFHMKTLKSMFHSSCCFLPQVVDQSTILKMTDQPNLCIKVKEMVLEDDGKTTSDLCSVGFINASTSVSFVRKENSHISLSCIHEGRGKEETLDTVWSFANMGVGGLDQELSNIYKSIFVSRVLPATLIEQIGIKHVKGILLHGPTGTGKTLVAKLISGMGLKHQRGVHTQILSMHVKTSEQKLLEFFDAAEKSEAHHGADSPLHVVVLEEIAAICTERGHEGHGHQRHEVFDLLLTKMDGDESLNNILIIGTTNCKDLIDQALLRPGRFDVHLETELPNEKARQEILNIHTRRLRENGNLADNVDLHEVAQITMNFSGAELERLVRSACCIAMNRLVEIEGHIVSQPHAIHDLCYLDKSVASHLKVEQKDLMLVIEKEIIPKYGVQKQNAVLDHPFINYGPPMDDVLSKAFLLLSQLDQSKTHQAGSLLLRGSSGSGKTSLAVQIAYKMSGYAYVTACSPQKFIGMSSHQKCMILRDLLTTASVSSTSCIVLEDIEHMIGYLPHDDTVSYPDVLQNLLLLLRTRTRSDRKLFIVATTCMSNEVLSKLQLSECFGEVVNVPMLCDGDSVVAVLQALQSSAKTIRTDETAFTATEVETISSFISGAKNIELSMKQIVHLYDKYMGEGKEKNIDNFLCWLRVECELEALS